MVYYKRSRNHPYFTLYMEQAQDRTNTKWTQVYLDDFLSNIGGLFTSLFKTAAFLFLGYEQFVTQKSMLKRLYGEEAHEREEAASEQNCKSTEEQLRDKMERKRNFDFSFCMFKLVSCFQSICCCFEQCFRKGRWRRRLDSHSKLQIAMDRLKQEQDI